MPAHGAFYYAPYLHPTPQDAAQHLRHTRCLLHDFHLATPACRFAADTVRHLSKCNLRQPDVIAKVPEDQRSAAQRRRAQRFEEFGCATRHELAPGKMELTEVGAKLSHLHLGCVDVEKLVAAKTAAGR
jgi:hypothetical protein